MALRRGEIGWGRRSEDGSGRGEGMMKVGGGIGGGAQELEVAEETIGPFAGGAGGGVSEFGGFSLGWMGEYWRSKQSWIPNACGSHALHSTCCCLNPSLLDTHSSSPASRR